MLADMAQALQEVGYRVLFVVHLDGIFRHGIESLVLYAMNSEIIFQFGSLVLQRFFFFLELFGLTLHNVLCQLACQTAHAIAFREHMGDESALARGNPCAADCPASGGIGDRGSLHGSRVHLVKKRIGRKSPETE